MALTDSPVAATVLADAARSTQAGRARLTMLARDLFVDETVRVDEARRTRIRALMTAVMRMIDGRIRGELHVRLAGILPTDVLMALGNMTLAIAQDSDVPVDPDLLAVLARRVDEHRLIVQAHVAMGQDPLLVVQPVLDGLLAQANGPVATAARTLADREVARRGRFEEPMLTVEDLPATVRARLTWRIAAAIRSWIARQGVTMTGAIDRAVAAATGSVLAAQAPVPDGDAVAIDLAEAMLRTGLADDAGTVAFAVQGHVAVGVAGLALRAGIGMATAWDMVLDPGGARLVVLLRAAAINRGAAAALLLRWPDGAASFDAIADRMAKYDALSAAAAQDAIDLYRLDPDYVAALDAVPQTGAR